MHTGTFNERQISHMTFFFLSRSLIGRHTRPSSRVSFVPPKSISLLAFSKAICVYNPKSLTTSLEVWSLLENVIIKLDSLPLDFLLVRTVQCLSQKRLTNFL